jgi:hypothetical protein
MNDEFLKDLEGDIPGLRKTRKTSARIFGVPPEIRTEHHPNIGLDESALLSHAVS